MTDTIVKDEVESQSDYLLLGVCVCVIVTFVVRGENRKRKKMCTYYEVNKSKMYPLGHLFATRDKTVFDPVN